MRRCFELALQGESYVAPNPMVGAVLVCNDTIIGEGYHKCYGEAHAEVNCLKSVAEENKHLISSSTLYVSLEPCAHHGKTPPCVDLIIKHKIPKVVISVQDNFDLVNGKGIQKLKEHGIEVVTGILEEEGKDLIKHFLHFHQYKKPYVTLKFAQTKDGFIGIKYFEIKVSNELSKRYTHHLRAAHQSILIGKNTLVSDDPELTVRYWKGKNPIRFVLGDSTTIRRNANIFGNEDETFFLHSNDEQRLSINEILKKISNKKIISVLVEGGADVLQQFIDANTWNEAHVITSDEGINRPTTTTINQQSDYIKSPTITGDLMNTIQLEDDTIQILKNPNAVFTA